jgi:hypothetical protein
VHAILLLGVLHINNIWGIRPSEDFPSWGEKPIKLRNAGPLSWFFSLVEGGGDQVFSYIYVYIK